MAHKTANEPPGATMPRVSTTSPTNRPRASGGGSGSDAAHEACEALRSQRLHQHHQHESLAVGERVTEARV